MTSRYKVTVEVLDARDDSHVSWWAVTLSDGDDVLNAVGVPSSDIVKESPPDKDDNLWGSYKHDILATRVLHAVAAKTVYETIGRNVVSAK